MQQEAEKVRISCRITKSRIQTYTRNVSYLPRFHRNIG